MSNKLIKYWFGAASSRGIGVTAYNIEDAVSLVASNPTAMSFEPDLNDCTENIDVQQLDQNHVIPNMGVCSIRGIWFPNLGN